MINFHKYEGAGNDFIMINNLDKRIVLAPEQIRQFCDRNMGIGADGIILLEPSSLADCFMNYYNSNGTVAEMCGNGIRCTAKFYFGETSKALKRLFIETRAGIKVVLANEDGTFSVDMGEPQFASNDFPSEDKNIEGFNFQFVSMGNPHAVTIVENLDNIDIKTIGPKIETDKIFPNRINAEFIQKINPARPLEGAGGDNYYKVKVWERGCGATLACGTGACAVFAILKCARADLAHIGPSYVEKEMTMEFPGGKLFLSQNNENHILLRGPAEFVFKGEI